MRRLGRAVVLGVVMAIALAAVGLAAASRGASQAGTTGTKRVETFSLTGELAAVSSDVLTVKVQSSTSNVKAFVHDGQVNVKLTKDTVIRLGKRTVSANELAAGETVKVSGTVAKGAPGELVAQVVTILKLK